MTMMGLYRQISPINWDRSEFIPKHTIPHPSKIGMVEQPHGVAAGTERRASPGLIGALFFPVQEFAPRSVRPASKKDGWFNFCEFCLFCLNFIVGTGMTYNFINQTDPLE